MIFFASILSLMYACKPNTNNDAAQMAMMKQSVIDSVNRQMTIAQQQKTIDSLEVVAKKPTKKPAKTAKTVVVERTTTSSEPAPMVGSVSKSKKGMSGAAKGALIGAGVGAVTGAMGSKKNKGKGAIIGGILGGGAGAGVGVLIDKKNKEKEKQQ